MEPNFCLKFYYLFNIFMTILETFVMKKRSIKIWFLYPLIFAYLQIHRWYPKSCQFYQCNFFLFILLTVLKILISFWIQIVLFLDFFGTQNYFMVAHIAFYFLNKNFVENKMSYEHFRCQINIAPNCIL